MAYGSQWQRCRCYCSDGFREDDIVCASCNASYQCVSTPLPHTFLYNSCFFLIYPGNPFWPLAMVQLPLYLPPLENLQYKSSRSALNLGNPVLFESYTRINHKSDPIRVSVTLLYMVVPRKVHKFGICSVGLKLSSQLLDVSSTCLRRKKQICGEWPIW